MASVAALGFSIISRYSGGGVAAARRDLATLRAQMATMNNDLRQHSDLLSGVPQRWKAIGGAMAALTPALIPISGAILQASGALVALGTAAGASLGAYGAAMKGAITQTLAMAKAGKALSPVQKEFVSAVNGMKSAWQGFIKETQGQTLATATNVVKGLTSGIKLLKPLIDAIHPSLLQVSKDFATWMKGDSAKNYAGIIAGIAKTSMPLLMQAGKDTLNFLGDGFRAFAPLANDMARSIANGAAALRGWSDGGGFQRFLAYTESHGPAVRQFFDAFGAALKNLFQIFAGFSNGALSVLTDSLRAIAALDPAAVKAFAQAFLLLRSPIAFLVLNCPPLRDAMIALLGAMNPATIYAVAGAFVVLRVATQAFGVALLTTPVGLIITGLAALAVAITFIATKTTWFQTAWTYTWNAIVTAWNAVYGFLSNGLGQFALLLLGPIGILLILANNWSTIWNGIKMVASVVWTALQVAWTATVNALSVAWSAVSGAMVTAWSAVWNGMQLAATTVWNALTIAWNAVVTGLTTAWTAVSGALVVAWNAVWNGLSLAATTVWNAMTIAWTAFVNALATAWTTVSTALTTAWNAVWTAMQVAAQAVWTALQVAWTAFVNALSVAWTTVSSALVATWNAVWSGMSTAAQAVWSAMSTAWNAFINGLNTIWTSVSSAMSASWNAIWNAMKAAAQAVWSAMQAAWNALLTTMQSLWSTIGGALSAAWSATWTAIRTVAEGIYHQIQSWWQGCLNFLTTVWNTFKAAFTVSWQTAWTAIRTIAEGIFHQIQSWWQQCLNFLTTVWNTFKAAFTTAWNAAWTAIRDFAEGIFHNIQDWWKQCTEFIGNVWDKFSSTFKEAWSDTWNAVKKVAHDIWTDIGGVIEKAINGIIGIINSLIGGFNKVAEFLHIDVSIGKIGKVDFEKFADGGMVQYKYGGMTGAPKDMRGGGHLTGYAPGRDTVPAVLSRGEGVLTPEAVRGLGGPGFVHSANRTYAGHRGAGKGGKDWGKKRRRGHHFGREGFADGGMVGGIQHFAVGGMTAAALAKAGVSLGMVTQGEHSNGSLSGGTHTGTGAVDIASTSPAVLQALINAGFAAWIRGPAQGFEPHIHAVLMNSPGLSPSAAAQVADFKNGGDGLGAGGGGGGGGAPSWLEPLLSKAGEIISKVAQGLPLGGLLGSIFGDSGGDKKDDGGGIFGTGIGPDIGPDITPGKDLGDAVGKVVGGVAKFMIPGLGVDLGKFLLGLIPDDAFEFGFKWITDRLTGFSPGAGGFGEIVKAMGSKAIKGTIDFLIGENAKKKEEAEAFVASLSGYGAMSGDVSSYAGMVAQALAKAGIPANQLNAFLALMAAESGGNPKAINGWDSNAMIGQASRGLMQVIPSTFAAYRDKSLPNDIFDPMANIQAAANYIKAVYGNKVPGSPYALGTSGATSGVHLVGEQGPELVNFSGGQTVTPAKETASILSGAGSEGVAPEDMMGNFQSLMALAQQMAAKIQQAWTAVVGSGKSAQSGMAPVFSDMAAQLGTTVPGALTTMTTANGAAWTAIQTATTTQWSALRDGVYTEAGDHMSVKMPQWSTEMDTGVTAAWTDMAAATSAQWTAMEEGTSTPVNWIIDNSYNNGIAAMWNAVAGVIWEGGGKELPTVAHLATGGPVRGPGTGTSDSIPAMLSRGEHVLTARDVRKAGGHQAIYRMRAGLGGEPPMGFATGGAVGDLKRGALWPAIEGNMKSAVDSTKSQLTDLFGRTAGSSDITSPADWIEQYVKKDDEINKFVGGPPWIPGVSDALTSFQGFTVNQRTADMLNAAMALGASFSLSQGSYNVGVAASAGTHDGGGVVDLTPATSTNVGALRAVGFAAWGRGPEWGSPVFSSHIHAVALGDPTVSPGAAAQQASFLAGGNGLADGGPDNFSGGLPSVAYKNVDPSDIKQNVVSYDSGGYLQPGYTLAYNGTGKPEPVGHDLVPRGAGGDVHVTMPISVQGNLDPKAVKQLETEVLPKLRVLLAKGTGK